MKPFILLFIGLFVLASCATLSEDECRVGAWGEIGFEDGAEGRRTSHLAKHAKACAEYGIEPNQTAWLAGRTQGLVRYCTPAKAYQVGRRGDRLSPVCSAEDLALMDPAWAHGRQYYRIRQQIQHLRSDRQRLRSEILSLADDEDASGRIALLHSESRFIDLDILQLELRLARYDRWPPR